MMFEELKIMSAKKFSYEIEEFVKRTGVSHWDAVLEYCSDNKLEPETVASLITKPLK
jgi:hypothetical protein